MPRNATIVAQKSDQWFDQCQINLIDLWSMLDRRFFINKHFDAIQTLLVSLFIVTTFIITIIVTSTWIANQQTNLFGSNKSSLTNLIQKGWKFIWKLQRCPQQAKAPMLPPPKSGVVSPPQDSSWECLLRRSRSKKIVVLRHWKKAMICSRRFRYLC